ncbi:hypothetical protein GGR56DRAFT_645972 [Xylariaceae sp. FL0804]|nr:hypothetical protein GGR56DRAFT_645972 [Xylariaceae sp. FL0804]
MASLKQIIILAAAHLAAAAPSGISEGVAQRSTGCSDLCWYDCSINPGPTSSDYPSCIQSCNACVADNNKVKRDVVKEAVVEKRGADECSDLCWYDCSVNPGPLSSDYPSCIQSCNECVADNKVKRAVDECSDMCWYDCTVSPGPLSADYGSCISDCNSCVVNSKVKRAAVADEQSTAEKRFNANCWYECTITPGVGSDDYNDCLRTCTEQV